MKTKFFALLCSLFVFAFAFNAFAEENAQVGADAAEQVSEENTAQLAASTVQSGSCGTNVKYTLDSDGTLTISGKGAMNDYSSSNVPWYSNRSSVKKVVIEDGVTSIGKFAFWNCSRLTSVTIPDSVTSIGSYAFYNCSGLTSVTIPDSVTSIGSYAFYNCSGLTSVTIPDSVTSIDSSAFSGCSRLTSVTIPDSVTSIDSSAFSGCSRLTSVTIPDSVTSIGGWAFENCSSLTSVTIGDSVTSIGYAAFSDCSSLTSITIPDNVTNLDPAVFEDCVNLTSIVLGNSVTRIWNDTFSNCSSLTSIAIPDSVTSIGSYAFQECRSLTSVTIGNSVIWIGDYAFCGCSSLTSITIPDSVTSIGSNAFAYCSSLTSVTIGNSVTSIGSNAFEDCSRLTIITIPDSVTNIGNEAFYQCDNIEKVHISSIESWLKIDFDGYLSNPLIDSSKAQLYVDGNVLTEVIIPDNITNIVDNAFKGCSSLTSVTIPDSVTSIGYEAFYGCSGLTSMIVGNGVTSIGGNAFSDCGSLNITISETNQNYSSIDGVLFNKNKTTLIAYSKDKIQNKYNIPNGVTSIGDSAFEYCDSLTSITIPDSVTSIGYSAFEDCSSIEEVHINSVESWLKIDFGYYSNPLAVSSKAKLYVNGNALTQVFIPYGVTSIYSSAFKNCNSLTSVTIPDSVTSIGDSAFEGCSSLTNITISNSVTSIGDNAFYNTGYYNDSSNWENDVFYISNWLIESKDALSGHYSVRENCVGIADNAFSTCRKLISITLPDSVTSIGNYAFYYCRGLTSVTIPDSVTSIGDSAFYYCNSLTSVTIPDSVTSIGDSAFEGCSSLTNITISNSVTSIGDDAFYNTGYYNNESNWENGVLYISNWLITAEYPFHEHYSVRENCVGIADYAFLGGKKLISITIPDSVISIGSGVFIGCSNLTKVTIGNSVTSIGSSAFADANNIQEIYIYSIECWENIHFGNEHSNPLFGAPNAKLYFIDYTPIKSIKLSTTKASMVAGGEVLNLLEYIVASPANHSDTLTWSSANEKVATVDQSGVVTAVGKGSAKITVKSRSGKSAYCTVTVGVPADMVEITPLKTTSVAVNKTLTIKAKAAREDGQKPVSTNVVYSIVSGEDCGTIDAKGKFTAKAIGDVTIRATAEASLNGAYDEITISVVVPITTLKMSSTKASMVVGGDSLNLAEKLTVAPANNTDKLTWSSANENVATVNQDGVVKAVGKGSAKITVKSGSGKSAYCTVTVGVPADMVEITPLKTTSVAVNKTLTIKAKAAREDGQKPVSTNVVYSIVSGEDCGTIDAKGKFTAKAIGDVTIRATAEASLNGAYDEITISVVVPITTLKMSSTKASMVVGGDSLNLAEKLTVAPANNTDKLTWSSANENVATVNQDGVVKAVGKGSAKITVKSGSGKSAYCTVTVGVPADMIEITPLKTTSVAVNKTLTIKAKAAREDGQKPVSTNVVYSIVSGEDCGTIDAKGKFTAKAIGDVVIRATAEASLNGAYDEIVVTVVPTLYKAELTQANITIGVDETIDVVEFVKAYTKEGQEIDVQEYCEITLKSSSTSKVKVVSGSEICGVSKGSTTVKITVKCSSSKTITLNVNVVEERQAELQDEEIEQVEGEIQTDDTQVEEVQIDEEIQTPDEEESIESPSENVETLETEQQEPVIEEQIPETVEAPIPVSVIEEI